MDEFGDTLESREHDPSFFSVSARARSQVRGPISIAFFLLTAISQAMA
jgi:hypothetical protein